MKKCKLLALLICFIMLTVTIGANAETVGSSSKAGACSHVDEYGYALYGTVLETWQEHTYYASFGHYTVEYERYICGSCGEEAVHFTDWYGDHEFDRDGYCIECNCTEDGTPRATATPAVTATPTPTPTPIPTPSPKDSCRLDELTDIDYLALSSLAYKNAPSSQVTIQEMLSERWNEVWDKKPFEGKYGTSDIYNYELYDHIKEWRYYDCAENKDNGFFAMAFINDHDEVVIAYRGSIPLDGVDWSDEAEVNDVIGDWILNDLPAILASDGNDASQIPDAFAFYRKIVNGRSAEKIGVTGHSLGGALANIVSAWSRCTGRTVNAISALDVAYVLWAGQLSETFTGVEDWQFVDIVNVGDDFGGAYGVELKPARIYKSDNPGYSIIGTLKHHGINTLLIKDQFNKITLTPQQGVNVPTSMNWPMKGINRTLQMGSIKDDEFNPLEAVMAWGFSMKDWKNMIFLGTTSFGGKGNDEIITYYFNDTLIGGPDDDNLDGYWGSDIYFYNNGDGLDTIYDIHGQDRIYLQGFSSSDVITIEHSSSNDPFASVCCNGEEMIRIYNKRADHAMNTLTLQNGLMGEYDITSKLKQPYVKIQGRYEFSCPIDIDILDADGNVVYTVKDSQLGNFYTDYGNFYVLPNEDSQYNSKILDIFEGYTVKIRGIGEGTMSVLVQDTDNYELLDACGTTDVAITPGTVGTLVTDEDTGVTYLLIDGNNDGTTDETIPLTPVHIDADDHDQPMQHIAGIPSTCVEAGQLEHYVCSCGKVFFDAMGEKEVTDPNDLILPANGIHQYANGICSVCGDRQAEAPKAGDTTPLLMLMILSMLSAGSVLVIGRKMKKE